MTKTISDKVATFISALGATAKSIIKMLLQSRRCTISRSKECDKPLIIMGNGPSLNDTITKHRDALAKYPTLAVNFAACAEVFTSLRPQYYVLADPHFFSDADTGNLKRLRAVLAGEVDWAMTLLVPHRERAAARRLIGNNRYISIATFNPVGVEGFEWVERIAYGHGWGMPRPRNVLIPSIMIGIQLGYKEIYITGADHSWMKTLNVDEQNRVVSIQPHFYKDGEEEKTRINTEYHNYPLHQIVHSFYVAFKAYHTIERYAGSKGIEIYNATPASYIDAFERKPLP